MLTINLGTSLFCDNPDSSAPKKTLEVSTIYSILTSGLTKLNFTWLITLFAVIGVVTYSIVQSAQLPLYAIIGISLYTMALINFSFPKSGTGNAKPYAYQIGGVINIFLGMLTLGIYVIAPTFVILPIIFGLIANRQLYFAIKDDLWYTVLNPPGRLLLLVTRIPFVIAITLYFTTGIVTAQTIFLFVGLSIGSMVLYALVRTFMSVEEQLNQHAAKSGSKDGFEMNIENGKMLQSKIDEVNNQLQKKNIDFQIHRPPQVDFTRGDYREIDKDVSELNEIIMEQSNDTELYTDITTIQQNLQEINDNLQFVRHK